jgi:hypothetical protein
VAWSIDCGHFPLTQRRALFKFKTVFIPRMKHPHDLRRIIGVGMLLFVFFLPLHFHPVATSVKVAKECSCVQGTRTLASLVPAAADWTPVLTAQPVQSGSFDYSSTVRFQIHGIRAPPLTPSL